MKGSPSGEGSAIHTSAPPPGPFSAWALPPCAAATAATMASPRPEPDRRSAAPRAKRSRRGAGSRARSRRPRHGRAARPRRRRRGRRCGWPRRHGAGRSRRGCQRLAQAVAIGVGDQRRPVLDHERPAGLGRRGGERGGHRLHDGVNGEWLGPDRQRILVEPSEGQQLLGERDETVGLLGGRAHHAPELLAIGGAGRGELELALEDGERRAQLMAGVGDEGALARAGTSQPREHLVQRGAQPADLVASLREGRRASGSAAEMVAARLRIASTGRSAPEASA